MSWHPPDNSSRCVSNGIDTMAFELLKQGGFTSDERDVLQSVKHSNDKFLNQKFGPNPFWGKDDHSIDALEAVKSVVKARSDRKK